MLINFQQMPNDNGYWFLDAGFFTRAKSLRREKEDFVDLSSI